MPVHHIDKQRSLRAAVILATLAALTAGACDQKSARDQPPLKVKVDPMLSYERFRIDLSEHGKECSDPGVECVGPDTDCQNRAMRIAGTALKVSHVKSSAAKVGNVTFSMTKDVIVAMHPEVKTAAETVDVLKRFFESETFGDFIKSMGEYVAGKGSEKALERLAGEDALAGWVAENLGQQVYSKLFPDGALDHLEEFTNNHTTCGEQYIVLGRRREQGRIRFTFAAMGDCGCRPGGIRCGKWSIVGGADVVHVIEPLPDNDGILIKMKLGRANYRVNADCKCDGAHDGWAAATPANDGKPSAEAERFALLRETHQHCTSPDGTLQNGDFEQGVGIGGEFVEVSGSGSIRGWCSQTVDYIRTHYGSAKGERSIDLNASPTRGAVFQRVRTVPGMRYTVRFQLGANPYCEKGIKTMRVSAGGSSREFQVDSSTMTMKHVAWSPQSFDFTANSNFTVLRFESVSDTSCGPALDSVELEGPPEL